MGRALVEEPVDVIRVVLSGAVAPPRFGLVVRRVREDGALVLFAHGSAEAGAFAAITELSPNDL